MRWSMSILVVGATLAASPANAHSCRITNTDKVNVDRTIRSFYSALATDDEAAFQRTVTTDFGSVDAGERMNARELFDIVEGAHKSGRVINWTIGPVAVRGDCDMTWAAWENVGSAGVPPKMAPRRWLESAVLRRVKGEWRIEFFHSSQVRPIEVKAAGAPR